MMVLLLNLEKDAKEVVMQGTASFTLFLALIVAPVSQAADRNEQVTSLRRAAGNQLGLLEYCRSQGLASETAVSAQRRTVEALPLVAAPDIGELEEAEGRLGYLAFDHRQASFADSTKAQGITMATACEARAILAIGGQ